jgi:hypothetical protein
MKHAPIAVMAASIVALALASVSGCDRPDEPKTVVVEKPVIMREKTVVIRDDRDRDHHDGGMDAHRDDGVRPDDHGGDHMGDHRGEPHGPPPVGDRR